MDRDNAEFIESTITSLSHNLIITDEELTHTLGLLSFIPLEPHISEEDDRRLRTVRAQLEPFIWALTFKRKTDFYPFTQFLAEQKVIEIEDMKSLLEEKDIEVKDEVKEVKSIRNWANLRIVEIEWAQNMREHWLRLPRATEHQLQMFLRRLLKEGIVKNIISLLTGAHVQQYFASRQQQPSKLINCSLEFGIGSPLWTEILGYLTLGERAGVLSRVSRSYYLMVQASKVYEPTVVFLDRRWVRRSQWPKRDRELFKQNPEYKIMVPTYLLSIHRNEGNYPTVRRVREQIKKEIYKPQHTYNLRSYAWMSFSGGINRKRLFYPPTLKRTLRSLYALMIFVAALTRVIFAEVPEVGTLLIGFSIALMFLMESRMSSQYPYIYRNSIGFDMPMLNDHLHRYADTSLSARFNVRSQSQPGILYRLFPSLHRQSHESKGRERKIQAASQAMSDHPLKIKTF